jgi:transposase InsO family protein
MTNEDWLTCQALNTSTLKNWSVTPSISVMKADLVCHALINMVIKNAQPSQRLIVHSDRGSQYCSNDYH